MVQVDTQIEELFQAGSHLGHKTNRVHPKAKKNIYTIQNGVSIIDLTKTSTLLENAKKFIVQLKKEGKILLVVVTKKIASTYTQELCKSKGISYITIKWPAGLFTNFEMIMKNVKKMNTMKKERDEGEWNKFVKHEQTQMNKELNKLEKFYGGLSQIQKLPDALFVVDVKKEKNAVKESREKGIPVIAIADTNVDPDSVDFPIPANDDSESSIEYIVDQLVSAYGKGEKA